MESNTVDFRALLRAVGYHVDSAELQADAVGPATRLALRGFERSRLLPESGLPDLATISGQTLDVKVMMNRDTVIVSTVEGADSSKPQAEGR